MLEWKHAWVLTLLAVPAALALLGVGWGRRRPAAAVGSAAPFRHTGKSWRTRVAWLPFALRLAALVLMVLTVARPRTSDRFDEVITHGVDMIVALDVSGSMRAEDFRPQNRLTVAKEVVRRFIDTREHDRLGLVLFAGKAFTQCPLTIDYPLLKGFVDAVDFDSIDQDGTAIGMAIATAVNRLRKSDAVSRVVVLVTDGISNRGAIDPLTAARLAHAIGARVYTVGVGTEGAAPIPVGDHYEYYELPLDEKSLREIATLTGGYYFRATDPISFSEALQRIGELETSRIETTQFVSYDELYLPFLIGCVGLLGLEGLLSGLVLRRLP